MGMRTIPTEYYGDNTRWFVGTVINSNPPAGLEGRVQVRIFGVHSDTTDNIPQKDLPWAQVMISSSSFGVSGLGVGVHIQAGAHVFGFFLDGVNSQLPLILGTMPRIEYPTSVQAAGREDLSSNPFAYEFTQSNSNMTDPVLQDKDNITPTESVQFFIDNGMTAKAASSVTGVLQEISGLNPNNKGGIAGYPTDSPRFARFQAYSQRLLPSKSPNSGDVQLMFVLHELHTTHKTAYGKLLRSKEIKGTLYGEKVDGLPIKNGMVAALVKYYVHPLTKCSQGSAESKAKSIYNSLGAR